MNKIVLGTLFSAMAVLTACDLDKYPETNISTETAWQTIDDATRFETGLYSFLQTINGGLYIYAADYQSDLFIIRKSKCSRISKRKVHFTKRNV